MSKSNNSNNGSKGFNGSNVFSKNENNRSSSRNRNSSRNRSSSKKSKSRKSMANPFSTVYKYLTRPSQKELERLEKRRIRIEEEQEAIRKELAEDRVRRAILLAEAREERERESTGNFRTSSPRKNSFRTSTAPIRGHNALKKDFSPPRNGQNQRGVGSYKWYNNF